MPQLSEEELSLRSEIDDLEKELAVVKADDDMSHFPDPASFGIKRPPEEIKASFIELLETKIERLKRKSAAYS